VGNGVERLAEAAQSRIAVLGLLVNLRPATAWRLFSDGSRADSAELLNEVAETAAIARALCPPLQHASQQQTQHRNERMHDQLLVRPGILRTEGANPSWSR